jgi:3-oxoadipate enol-lactonase
MRAMNAIQRIDIGNAALEIAIGAAPPFIAAAHPADGFGAATVALLEDTSGAGAVAINPRGVGGSSPRPAAHGLEEMVDDVEAARLRLGLPPWLFWGMSGGGWLGQIYARKHRPAVRGLILESVCPCYRERLADPACLLSPFQPSWRPALAGWGLIAADSHAALGDPADTEWIEIDGVGSVFRRRNGPALLVAPFPIDATLRGVMPILWAADARSWLSTLRVPTLIICGTADPVLPVPHARALQQAIPGSDLVVIDGAGHVPTAQRCTEVAEAVRAFLRKL